MAIGLLTCETCGKGPFANPHGLKVHGDRVHSKKKKPVRAESKSSKRTLPVHAKFCYNCGIPQPTEVTL